MEPKRRHRPQRASAPGEQHRGFAVVPIDQRNLAVCISHVDTLDEFLSSLQLQAEIESEGNVDGMHPCSATRSIRALRVAEQAARNHAQLGVDRIIFRAGDRGRMRVTAGGFPEQQMGKAVAETLRALASNTGGQATNDGLVPWKTYEDLAWSIRERTGRAPSVHALSNNIYRLRRAVAVGGNPFLVQTDARRRLARFALSSVGRLIDGDEPA